jgi:hypothetical protein
VSHAELQHRIIESKNEEIERLKELLGEWCKTPDYDWHNVRRLIERTWEELKK